MPRRNVRSNRATTPKTESRGAAERVVPQPVASNERRPPGVKPSEGGQRDTTRGDGGSDQAAE